MAKLKGRLTWGRGNWLLIVLVAVGLPSEVSAATRYIDSTLGSNCLTTYDVTTRTCGPGSEIAYNTVAGAMSAAVAGDVLTLRGATYTISTLTTSSSGTSGNTITMNEYSGETAIITGTSGIRLNLNHNYWTLDGFILDQANIVSDAIKVNGTNIIMRNMEIRNGQREGIAIENADVVLIEDSSIHDFSWIVGQTRNDAHCIMIDTGVSTTITDIKIHRNTIQNCSGDGAQVFGTTGQPIAEYATNLEFIDNVFIEGNGGTPGLTENALDFKAADTALVRGNTMSGYINNKTIVVQKGCRNITIQNNTIRDGLSGIEMRQEGGASFIQQNQVIRGNIVETMSSYGLKFDGVANVTVIHNTLSGIGAQSFVFESTLGGGTPSVNGGSIKNNLFHSVTSAPSGVSTISGVVFTNNGWFTATAGGLSHASDTTGSDPLFVNPAENNYALQASSPAIDQGVDLGYSFSGSAPDLGALEFSFSSTGTVGRHPGFMRR